MSEESIPCGDEVMCDFCCEDFTNSDAIGGFLFGSYALCPECARKHLPDIIQNGESRRIKEHCPPDLSFADWVRRLRYRTGDDQIIIRT